MQRSLNRTCALVLGLQAAVIAAACSTSAPSAPPAAKGGSGGEGGSGGNGGIAGGGGTGGGGTGGGGAGGAGGSNADHSWLDDPDVWTPLPGQEGWDDLCSYATADPDRIDFPTLEWEPCGEGCERADVGHGYFERSSAYALSTSSDGVPHLLLTQGSVGDPIWFQRIVDLRSGESIAAMRGVKSGMLLIDGSEYTPCSGSAYTKLGTEIGAFRAFGDGRPSIHIRGVWQRESRSWLWQLPWTTDAERGFSTYYCTSLSMEAGGRTFWLCLEGLYGTPVPGSSRHERLESFDDGYIGARLGDGLGDLIVWQQLHRDEIGSRVRGWRPDGKGVRTLLDDIPVDTCSVGLSPTHVAGFAKTNGCGGYGFGGRLWVARRAADDTLTDFRLGPIISPEKVAVAVTPLKVWGDFLAVGWGERYYETQADRGRLLLVRLSDWAMRDIPGPAGFEMGFPTLTDEYLYSVPADPGSRRLTHIYRYELAKFEQLGTPRQPVDDPAEASTDSRR